MADGSLEGTSEAGGFAVPHVLDAATPGARVLLRTTILVITCRQLQQTLTGAA